MSIARGNKVKCLNCGNENIFTIWHAINVDVNPEVRDKVKTGELFKYKCKNCQNIFDVEYKFMYHDMSNKFQVWYFPKKEYDINVECEKINNIDIVNKYNEKIRIVDNKKRLIEKIRIFEEGLSDIAIEVVKSIISGQIEDENLEIYYGNIKEDKIEFWLSNEINAMIPYSIYDSILKDYDIEEPRDCVNINIDTAFEYVKDKPTEKNYDEKNDDLEFCNEEIEYIKIVEDASNGLISNVEAKDFVKILAYYRLYGREKALEEFEFFSNKIAEKQGRVLYVTKISILLGILQSNSVITEQEMIEMREKIVNKELSKIVSTKKENNCKLNDSEDSKIKKEDNELNYTKKEKKKCFCINCGKTIEEVDSFCCYCGYNLQKDKVVYCMNCGNEMKKDWKFCRNCGKKAE